MRPIIGIVEIDPFHDLIPGFWGVEEFHRMNSV
jgi:hypothetical protein